MNILMTTYIYPLAEKVLLSRKLNAYLDNPRTDEEVEAVAGYIKRAYSVESAFRFPEYSDEDIVTLEGMISGFCEAFSGVDPYVKQFCGTYDRDSLYEFMARMWVVARYDDEGQVEVERQQRKEYRDKGEAVVALYEQEHPILKNSRRLAEYSYLLSLLTHTHPDEYTGYSFVLDSDPSQFGLDEINTQLCLRFFMFGMFSEQPREEVESEELRWQLFPFIRPELEANTRLLDAAFEAGLEDKLMYVASLLKTVGEDLADEKFKLVVLVSIIELLLTRNPDHSRFNVEDSISKQFRLKAGLLVYLNDKSRDLDEIRSRLKTIYSMRSNIAHGNFTAVNRYIGRLSTREGEEEYFSDLISDSYVYIKAIVSELLKDPKLVEFLKEN